MATKANDIHTKEFYRNILTKNPLFYGHQFVITFDGDIPDMIKSSQGNKSITYMVQSSKIPSIDIKEHNIAFLSQKFVIPGGVQYGDSWDVEFIITNDLAHYNALYEWQEWYSDLARDGGSKTNKEKGIPNTLAHVQLLDSTMQRALDEFVLVGIFPTKVPQLQMKYENQSTPIKGSCTFCYQYMYRKDEGDPLQA